MLRRDPATAGIRSSGYGEGQRKLTGCFGLSLGADDYITKPFSRSELVCALKRFFARKARSRNRSSSKI